MIARHTLRVLRAGAGRRRIISRPAVSLESRKGLATRTPASVVRRSGPISC